MTAFIEWMINQNPILIGVAVYLIMKIKHLETSVNNHIPTQINDLKERMTRLENDLKDRMTRIEIKLDRLIEK